MTRRSDYHPHWMSPKAEQRAEAIAKARREAEEFHARKSSKPEPRRVWVVG